MAGKKNSPRIVIIGAGATGRGQLGRLAYEAGFAITFIEAKRDLVDLLRSTKKYLVALAGEVIRLKEIAGFDILQTAELIRCVQAIASADITATAVLPTNLQAIAPLLAKGLSLRRQLNVRKPLNVFACENMERSSKTLREYVMRHIPRMDWTWVDRHVGFPDAMVACLVPWPADPLILLSEEVQEWSVDGRAVKQPMPPLRGMTLSPNLEAALEKKLYIKNTGHMTIGILGHLRGYGLMHEAARDPEIFGLAEAATKESAAAVVEKHGFDARETEEYRRSFLAQMRSPFLPDEIRRIIRELKRKLGPEERLVGPALLCIAQGRDPKALAEVIARAFTIANPDDPQSVEMRAMLEAQGIERTAESVCGIPNNHRLTQLVSSRFRKSVRAGDR
ncbi:MAG: hypothetical protein AB1715_00380 [Acidobacteriota bacterium]